MKIISHRGNMSGSNILTENRPAQIDLAIQTGYDVEIDLRVYQNNLYLGHDYPQYSTSLKWLGKRRSRLWIHCKDYKSLEIMSDGGFFNYFTHDSDPYTITSQGVVWCHPDSIYVPGGVYLYPESKGGIIPVDCYAICTDWPARWRSNV